VTHPIACDPGSPANSELVGDCGGCNAEYMASVGVSPTCGGPGPATSFTCAAHAPTTGVEGWLYSNEAFELLGHVVADAVGFGGS